MRYYLGIDPGEKGCIICILVGENDEVQGVLRQELEGREPIQVWDAILYLKDKWLKDNKGTIQAVIEEQTPRPTYWKDKKTGANKESILRSTVILYGNYRMLCGMLTAASIPYQSIVPRTWQRWYFPQDGKMGGSTTAWKNKLKAKARSLYPDYKLGLVHSDALLLAHYCREISNAAAV